MSIVKREREELTIQEKAQEVIDFVQTLTEAGDSMVISKWHDMIKADIELIKRNKKLRHALVVLGVQENIIDSIERKDE
jgi:hypothetical protein